MRSKRHIGKYGPIDTAKTAYVDGLKTGLEWDAPWIPGGPWICSDREYNYANNPDWKAYCEATRENNREWLRGWHDGVRNQPETLEHKPHHINKHSTYSRYMQNGKCACPYHQMRLEVQDEHVRKAG